MDVFSIVLAVSFSGLASPSFDIRERTPIPPVLAHFGLHHDDPEVRCRCERRLEAHRVASITRLIQSQTPTVWIDSLPPEWPDRCDIINSYLTAARDFYYEDQADWPHWRRAMELYLYSLSYEDAKAVLAVCPRGQYWSNGVLVTPPPKWVPTVP